MLHENVPATQTGGGVTGQNDDNPYVAYGEQATGGARNIIKFRKGRYFVSVRPDRPCAGPVLSGSLWRGS